MEKIIDLRSDTVTLPTKEMRQAIFDSQLGDDVFEEDPTVKDLEKKSANIMGKEAALLVPSGTMGNLVSILSHCNRGTEIILGDKSHTFYYEAGGISAFGGIHSRQLKNQNDGTINISDIKSAIRVDNIHFPRTSAISLENTHNLCNGSPLHTEYLHEVANLARENNLKIHIDGARIFNAAAALNIDVMDLVREVDSITFCLSKGLSAPVGSIICGDKEFIYNARRIRKALGGGMRQAGIIAAAGIVALDQMVDQIQIDHYHTKILSDGIEKIDGLIIDKENIKSNILYFEIENEKNRGKKLDNELSNNNQYPFDIKLDNIYFLETSPNKFRLVTHHGIKIDDIEKVLNVIQKMILK